MGINRSINEGTPVASEGALQSQAWVSQLLLHKQLTCNKEQPCLLQEPELQERRASVLLPERGTQTNQPPSLPWQSIA